MKILFSPVGNTDPICYCLDGPWFHSCRNILPDKCILFLTAGMCKREEDSHVFSKAMELLNGYLREKGKIESDIELELHKHSDIVNPHDSDIVLPVLTRELDAIHKAYPDAELYLNVRSGTPAIKGGLELLYHTSSYEMNLCYVKMDESDINKSRSGRRDTASDDVEEAWGQNLDNDDCQPSRLEIKNWKDVTQYGIRMELQQIRRLIDHYEYHAAKIALDSLGGFKPTEELIHALNGAVLRQRWNFKMACIELNKAHWNESQKITPYFADSHSENRLYKAAEAILTMKISRERMDTSDMLRRLTPVTLALCWQALLKTGIDPNDFVVKKDKECLDKEKLKKSYPNIYENQTVSNMMEKDLLNTVTLTLEDYHLIEILRAKTGNNDITDCLDFLRKVEKKHRNPAAHTLDFINLDEKDADTILKKVCVLAESIGIQKDYWKSYDRMSEFIIGLLDKQA